MDKFGKDNTKYVSLDFVALPINVSQKTSHISANHFIDIR